MPRLSKEEVYEALRQLSLPDVHDLMNRIALELAEFARRNPASPEAAAILAQDDVA